MRLVPRSVDSGDADDAIELGTAYGLTPDEWQADTLRAWLGRRRDGKWAANRCALAVPRQNGKNAVVEIRELYGMVVLGEKWLHTAHEVKTARKAFIRLASFFENPRKYPELAELVADIRKTNGQEAIVLTNGGSVEFVARSKGSGRGFTVDGLLLDEAQEASDEALEALLPTTSAGPLGNPQLIYTGTPPGPKANGEVFTRVRRAALAGKEPRLCYLEHGAPEDCDLDDPAMWARANPGLGYRIGLDEIRGERASFDDAGFARERLGIWDPDLGEGAVIPLDAWRMTADVESVIVGSVAFAVDVAPDRGRSAISVAGMSRDGRPHVELVRAEAGTEWVVPHLVGIAERNPGAPIALDPAGPAGSLIQDLRAARIDPLEVKTRDLTQACGRFYDLVVAGELRHRDEGVLNAAVAGARKRSVGDAWAWARKDARSDITPLYAATLALWAHAAGGAPADPGIYII